MFFFQASTRLEADSTVEIVQHIRCSGATWNHEPGEEVPRKIANRVDEEYWTQFLSAVQPLGSSLFLLAWAESFMMAAALALITTLFMVGQPVAALVGTLGMLAVYAGVNVLVTTRVRRQAASFCEKHGPELRAVGLRLTAHTDRWQFAITRMELWLEIEIEMALEAAVYGDLASRT